MGDSIASTVTTRMTQRRRLLSWLTGLVGPTSDRQLASALGAHPITLRRTINHGADVVKRQAATHASRVDIIEGIDKHLPARDQAEVVKLLRDAADAIESGGLAAVLRCSDG